MFSPVSDISFAGSENCQENWRSQRKRREMGGKERWTVAERDKNTEWELEG